MSQFVLSDFAKTFRKYNRTFTSDEECLNSLLKLITESLSGDNYRYDDFHLAKSDVSNIMRRKTEVPRFIREGIDKINLDVIADGFEDLLKTMDEPRIDDFKKDILKLCPDNNPALKASLQAGWTENPRFLTLAFCHCLSNKNKDVYKEEIWKRGKSRLVIESGNILSLAFDKRHSKATKIVVIPVDVGFTMDVQGLSEEGKGAVSPQSLHGKWIQKIGKSEAKARVGKYKMKNGIDDQIGSAIPFKKGNTVFYLLAISKFDGSNNAHASKSDLEKALTDLLVYYDQNGQGFPLYIPLIGTGLSRSGLSPKESIELIKDICLEQKDRIHGTVCIMPYTNDREALED